jgi:hypothetical protein
MLMHWSLTLIADYYSLKCSSFHLRAMNLARSVLCVVTPLLLIAVLLRQATHVLTLKPFFRVRSTSLSLLDGPLARPLEERLAWRNSILVPAAVSWDDDAVSFQDPCLHDVLVPVSFQTFSRRLALYGLLAAEVKDAWNCALTACVRFEARVVLTQRDGNIQEFHWVDTLLTLDLHLSLSLRVWNCLCFWFNES